MVGVVDGEGEQAHVEDDFDDADSRECNDLPVSVWFVLGFSHHLIVDFQSGCKQIH